MVQQHFLPQAIKVLLLSHLLFFPSQVLGQHLLREAVKVRVSQILDSLLYDEDTDGDRKITIDDPHIQGTERGDKRFWMASIDGKR
ncbi:MAG: trehalase calcium-binding domain-containing protein [Bacteroidota bacterium]